MLISSGLGRDYVHHTQTASCLSGGESRGAGGCLPHHNTLQFLHRDSIVSEQGERGKYSAFNSAFLATPNHGARPGSAVVDGSRSGHPRFRGCCAAGVLPAALHSIPCVLGT